LESLEVPCTCAEKAGIAIATSSLIIPLLEVLQPVASIRIIAVLDSDIATYPDELTSVVATESSLTEELREKILKYTIHGTYSFL
jgi:hypothetical protein